MINGRALLAAPLSFSLLACVPDSAQPRMSRDQAQNQCTERAKRYSQSPLMVPDSTGTIQLGLQAELPDDFMIRDFYRSCYRANTGVWPQSIPDIPSYN